MLMWEIDAWDDYVSWQKEDKKTLKKINTLIKAIIRSPYGGIGKTELLTGELAGLLSRRIDEKNRLVYKVFGYDTKNHLLPRPLWG